MADNYNKNDIQMTLKFQNWNFNLCESIEKLLAENICKNIHRPFYL